MDDWLSWLGALPPDPLLHDVCTRATVLWLSCCDLIAHDKVILSLGGVGDFFRSRDDLQIGGFRGLDPTVEVILLTGGPVRTWSLAGKRLAQPGARPTFGLNLSMQRR